MSREASEGLLSRRVSLLEWAWGGRLPRKRLGSIRSDPGGPFVPLALGALQGRQAEEMDCGVPAVIGGPPLGAGRKSFEPREAE